MTLHLSLLLKYFNPSPCERERAYKYFEIAFWIKMYFLSSDYEQKGRVHECMFHIICPLNVHLKNAHLRSSFNCSWGLLFLNPPINHLTSRGRWSLLRLNSSCEVNGLQALTTLIIHREVVFCNNKLQLLHSGSCTSMCCNFNIF